MPLHGIRVIDFSHSWAAPHSARLLADFGAEVIKIEYVRRLCLLRGARTDNQMYDKHPGWLQVNRNKYSVTLNLKIQEEREAFRDLIRISDIFIENSRPGVLKKLGFGYNDAVKLKPDIIYLSMSAFGKSGSYAAYAGYGAVFEGLGGIQGMTAYDRDSRPFRIKEIDVVNGIAGACAVLTALMYRQRTGKGQCIDLSQLEAATHTLIGEHLLEFVMNGKTALLMGNRSRFFAPQGCYPCKGDDQWIAITIRTENEWSAFCNIVGHSEWGSDPRFKTQKSRMQHHDALDEMIQAWTIQFTHTELMMKLQNAGIPACAVLNTKEICGDAHLNARGYFIKGVDGTARRFTGYPFRFPGGMNDIAKCGPKLGQHNEFILSGLLGRDRKQIRPVKPEEIKTAFDPNVGKDK